MQGIPVKISVALCTYNGEKYLVQQVDSILNQSKPVQEIVVCDDGSADGTMALMNEYAAAHPRLFRIFNNEPNLGARKNFEKAIGLCTGELIFLCDQDDEWSTGKVETVAAVLENDNSIQGVFSNARLIDEHNRLLAEDLWTSVGFTDSVSATVNRKNMFEFLMKYRNIVTGATLCIRNQQSKGLLPFLLPHESVWHDYWIAIKLSSENGLVFIEQPLGSYRVHSSQQVGLSTGYIRKFAGARIDNWLNESSRADHSTMMEYQHLIFGLMQVFYKALPAAQSVVRHRMKRLLKQQKHQLLHNHYRHLAWPNRKLFLLKRYIKKTSPVELGLWDVLSV